MTTSREWNAPLGHDERNVRKIMTQTSTTNFRQATEDDLAFLVNLRRLSMSDVVMRHQPWREDEQLSRVRSNYHAARIIEQDGRPVGLLKVVHATDHIHLSQIQLLPPYQNQGIGTKIILELQAECEPLQTPITLHAFSSSRAIVLYGRLGFKVAGISGESLAMRWEPKKRGE